MIYWFFFLKKLRPRNEQRENELIISFLRCLYEEKQKVHTHAGEIKQVWLFFPLLLILPGCCVKQNLEVFFSLSETFFLPVSYFYFLHIWGKFGNTETVLRGGVGLLVGVGQAPPQEGWCRASGMKFKSRYCYNRLLDLQGGSQSLSPPLSPW